MSRSSPPVLPLSPSEPIATGHDCDRFACGIEPLDEWLKHHALYGKTEGGSRTFVVCTGRSVVGYYSLIASSVHHGVVIRHKHRKLMDPVPTVLLSRLAVDRTWQRRGLGGDILNDAILRVLAASKHIGIHMLLVRALSDSAKRFYERHGFRPSPLESMTLMITMAEAQRMLVSEH